MHHFIVIGEFKLELQSGNAQFGSKSAIFFVLCDLEIWQMTLEKNRTTLLCYFKLCASCRNHLWIQTAVIIRKPPNWDQICFDLCDLDFWHLTLTFCMDNTSVNGNNFRMIRWQEHCQKVWRTDGQTDGRTDGQGERSVVRVAWLQLKCIIRSLVGHGGERRLVTLLWQCETFASEKLVHCQSLSYWHKV